MAAEETSQRLDNIEHSPSETAKRVIQARKASVVSQFQTLGTQDTKISYTVTASTTLYINLLFISIGENGGTVVVEAQADGTSFASMTLTDGGEAATSLNTEIATPWGPFVAGTVITFLRIAGDAGKDWSGGFQGWEET